MFNSTKIIAEQKEQITALEAKLAAANTERDAAQAKVTELEAKLTEADGLKEKALADLRAEHATALAAKDAETQARVDREVTDALASAGVPESGLPAARSKDAKGNTPGDIDAQIEDLNAQIAETKDPLEKGKLASQILALMDAKSASVKN